MEDACWDPPLPDDLVGLARYAILLLLGEKLTAGQLMALARAFDFGGQNLLQLRKSISNAHVLATELYPAELTAAVAILQREGILHEIVRAEYAEGPPLAKRSGFAY